MNTIPLIFNERQIVYTILGGKEEPHKVLMPVSCIVVGKSQKESRDKVFRNLMSKGFEKIISVEHTEGQFYSDGIQERFPEVKFIITSEDVTEGDLINIGMAEASSPYVLVLKEACCLSDFNFSLQIAKNLAKRNDICTAPLIYSHDRNSLPVLFIPSVEKSKFSTVEEFVFSEGKKTLYSCDSQGFYDREKFIQLGGFDYTIKSDYWQRLDFFVRAWLWGNKVSLTSSFSLNYNGEYEAVDKTVNISYLRFYLKNLAPVYKSDHAEIPKSTFFSFNFRSSCGIAEAFKQFLMARIWVKENMYRFKMDAASLIQNWEEK